MAERAADQPAADRAQHRALTTSLSLRAMTEVTMVIMVMIVIVWRRGRLSPNAARGRSC
jgi:hypothetical protein